MLRCWTPPADASSPLARLHAAASAAEEMAALERIVERARRHRTDSRWLCPRPADLTALAAYLLDRRYGWGETPDGAARCLPAADKLSMSLINELLDALLEWLAALPLLDEPVLAAVRDAAAHASARPMVRSQAFLFGFQYLAAHLAPPVVAALDPAASPLWVSLRDLVVAACVDVWSAIRKTSANKLGALVDKLSPAQLVDLMDAFFSIACNGDAQPWQCVDGCLLALHGLLRKCNGRALGPRPSSADSALRPSPAAQRDSSPQQQQQQQQALPPASLVAALQHRMHAIVVPLLGHAQLSVREAAAKVLSAYLTMAPSAEAQVVFVEILACLVGVVPLAEAHSCQSVAALDTLIKSTSAPDSTAARHRFRLNAVRKDPYEAEGLLTVCVNLARSVPDDMFATLNPHVADTIDRYLMHPASTVRQQASVLAKYFVVRCSRQPIQVKAALRLLAADWRVDVDSVLRVSRRSSQAISAAASSAALASWAGTLSAVAEQTSVSSPERSLSTTAVVDADADTHGADVPPTPHASRPSSAILTSPPTTASPPGPVLPPRPSSASRRTAPSIVQVAERLQQQQSSSSSGSSSWEDSWEWREGRLLAYELILKFLLSNHLHYVFPSALLQFALSPAAGPSAVTVTPARLFSHSGSAPGSAASVASPLPGASGAATGAASTATSTVARFGPTAPSRGSAAAAPALARPHMATSTPLRGVVAGDAQSGDGARALGVSLHYTARPGAADTTSPAQALRLNAVSTSGFALPASQRTGLARDMSMPSGPPSASGSNTPLVADHALLHGTVTDMSGSGLGSPESAGADGPLSPNGGGSSSRSAGTPGFAPRHMRRRSADLRHDSPGRAAAAAAAMTPSSAVAGALSTSTISPAVATAIQVATSPSASAAMSVSPGGGGAGAFASTLPPRPSSSGDEHRERGRGLFSDDAMGAGESESNESVDSQPHSNSADSAVLSSTLMRAMSLSASTSPSSASTSPQVGGAMSLSSLAVQSGGQPTPAGRTVSAGIVARSITPPQSERRRSADGAVSGHGVAGLHTPSISDVPEESVGTNVHGHGRLSVVVTPAAGSSSGGPAVLSASPGGAGGLFTPHSPRALSLLDQLRMQEAQMIRRGMLPSLPVESGEVMQQELAAVMSYRGESVHSMLQQVLLQTIESLGSQRWELRRMSDQVCHRRCRRCCRYRCRRCCCCCCCRRCYCRRCHCCCCRHRCRFCCCHRRCYRCVFASFCACASLVHCE
jgi:hypothetical protein